MAADRQDPAGYSALLVTKGYADLQEQFIKNYDLLDVGGYPNLAQLLRTAFLRFKSDMERIAKDTAVKASAFIRDEEATSRVRDDTGGDQSGKRLGDFVGESAPLFAVPGSVGVNFEPSLYDNVPWWWTNESGYSGHIGRVVHGFFYDAGYTGASRPDVGSFREHPLFRAEGPQRDSNAYSSHGTHQLDDAGDPFHHAPSNGPKGTRPGMLIQNPIPARQFVMRGVQRAEAEWHAEFAVAKARFDKELDRITSLIGQKP